MSISRLCFLALRTGPRNNGGLCSGVEFGCGSPHVETAYLKHYKAAIDLDIDSNFNALRNVDLPGTLSIKAPADALDHFGNIEPCGAADAQCICVCTGPA
jgi:hypothetical protein